MRSASSRADPDERSLLSHHLTLIGLVVIYGLVGLGLNFVYGQPIKTAKVGVLLQHFLTEIPKIVLFVLFWRLFHHSYVVRATDRVAAVKGDIQSFLTDRKRLLGGTVATLLMAVVLLVFAQIKSLIPAIQPFVWDPYFADLDRALHFGTDPYVVLHQLFGSETSLTFFTGVYNFWLLLVYFAQFVTCFLRSDSLNRMQFLVAFLLVWALGGNLLATLFSSAGPPYFALLGLGDTFAPLTALLERHADTGALTVVATQLLLWEFYTAPDSINVISAFPSMHVATSVLIAMHAARHSRLLGGVTAAFAVCMMIGSVLLGWHYAIDGYAGAMVAVLGWKFAGWLVNRPSRTSETGFTAGPNPH